MFEHMQSWLWKLQSRRFIVITGKGGTGKSIITCALALALNALGKKTLVVEMSHDKHQGFTRFAELLNLPSLGFVPKSAANPLNSGGSILASQVAFQDALMEYIQLKIRSQKLTKLILRNPVTTSLLKVVPGLPGLLTLGKIWHTLEQEKTLDRPDIVLLDAPASGHGISLLQSPSNFANITKKGPLYKNTQQIQSFLEDREKTAILFTCLPEEMATTEAREFIDKLQSTFPPPLPIMNKCYPLLTPSSVTVPEQTGPDYSSAWDYSQKRHQQESHHHKLFLQNYPQTLSLPFLFAETEQEILLGLGKHFLEQSNAKLS